MEVEDPSFGPFFQFMDDNSKVHRAIIVNFWKAQKGILSLEWPSASPDINIIENLWAYIEDRLYQVRETLKTPDDTWARTLEIWHSIDRDFINKLYRSLPDRMAALKENKGGPIPF